jgi:NTP pyrophosphatase (non-canonical NTP hydrolase)
MKKLEQKILKYLQARRWDHLRPVDLAKSIMIEGAELLELFQWENLPLETIKKDKAKREEIAKELADVLIYSIEMSILLGLDTEKIIRRKLAMVEKKYPAKVVRAYSKGSDPGTEKEYLAIKNKHRKKK